MLMVGIGVVFVSVIKLLTDSAVNTIMKSISSYTVFLGVNCSRPVQFELVMMTSQPETLFSLSHSL